MEAREAAVSDARMEAILSYIETTAGPDVGPNVLEVMMHELREAARVNSCGTRKRPVGTIAAAVHRGITSGNQVED
jgi:hypothetical protein